MIDAKTTLRDDVTTALPIYLERRDDSRRMARFYSIRIERTLFGDWSVIYGWGRIGSSGRHQEDWLATLGEVAVAVDRKLKQKVKRGYVVRSSSCSNREISHVF
jgi:predicted DNA-binding WGR domain protein